jgi:asparagine synthetase B (glutamine-hydrolysing)
MNAPSPLETAAGLVLGIDPPTPLPQPPGTPLEALELAILPALRRPPCLVSFSGGRDSSAVLAVAAAVARRNGLQAPVPATNRFPNAPGSDEAEWQERVVAHLRLDDWIRLEHDAELDCVGPVASRVLRRHGLLWPFNAHFHVPLLEAARGGSLLTGIGGDELLSEGATTRPLQVLIGLERPERRDALRIAWALAPRRLRAAVDRRRHPGRFPWLRPDALDAVRRALAEQGAREPLRRRGQLEWRLGFRYLAVGRASLAVLAADAGAEIAHPFLDPGFAAALAALRRPLRIAGRTQLMQAVFGGLLPAETIARRSKSHFDEAFWNESSRAFATGWSGAGVDRELVDVGVLRAEWASERPDPRTYTLLQAAWLADDSAGERLEEARDVVRHPLPAA